MAAKRKGKRKSNRRTRKEEAPGWIWMLFGLGLGLVVALGVYLNFGAGNFEAGNFGARNPGTGGAAGTANTNANARTQDAAAPAAVESTATAPATPISLPPQGGGAAALPPSTEPVDEDASPAPAVSPSAENRFDFYEMLPRFELVIPETESSAGPDSVPQPIVEPGRYVLQAGSFTRLTDADRRKASLALLGIESRIQRVSIDDTTFHRVRVGPLTDLAEVNRIRSRLRQARVDTLLIRVPE